MKKHILQENYERFFEKREFGDPLPTFEDVMKKHQVNKFKEDLDSVDKEDDDVDNDGDSDASDDYLKNRRDVISKAIETESIKEGWWDNMSDAAKKSYIKKHGSAPNVAGDDDYDMGVVPGSREEWEDIEPGDPEMRSGDESAEELGDLMKQQQNHIEDMFEKGADREDIEAAEGNLEDLEREYDEKVESGEGEDDEDDWGKKPDGDVDPDKFFKDRDKAKGLVKGKRQGRTGKELDQETLTIDGKQFRRISEGVEKESKPKYTFSEFYQRFKR